MLAVFASSRVYSSNVCIVKAILFYSSDLAAVPLASKGFVVVGLRWEHNNSLKKSQDNTFQKI